MARPRTTDGRRVPVSIKISEPEAALIDAARGDTERAVWIRDAAVDAASRKQITEPRPKRAPRPGPAEVTAGCPHPKTARLKGRCGRCRTFVGYS